MRVEVPHATDEVAGAGSLVNRSNMDRRIVHELQDKIVESTL